MLGRLSIFHFDAAVALALLASFSAAAAAAPVVDTQAPSQVTVVTREELEKLPTNRSVVDLLKVCPARTIPTVTNPLKGGSAGAPASGPNCVQPDDLRMIDIYKRHNQERAPFGYQPLRWNSALEATATARAQQLAQFRQLIHAPREGRGIERENLLGAPVGWTTDQMMNRWVGEKRYFHPGIYPNVCAGDWSQCAHYTQMIWPTTTDIGCGIAPGGGFNWLVCRYSPGGNKDGKPVGQVPMVAQATTSPGQPAATACNWIDVKTGKPVKSLPVMPDPVYTKDGEYVGPRAIAADLSDPNRAYDPKTGRNFAKVPVATPMTGLKPPR